MTRVPNSKRQRFRDQQLQIEVGHPARSQNDSKKNEGRKKDETPQ